MSAFKKYQKIQTVVEAVKLDGTLSQLTELKKSGLEVVYLESDESNNQVTDLVIRTLYGPTRVNEGHYIVKDWTGEIKPWIREVFEESFKPFDCANTVTLPDELTAENGAKWHLLGEFAETTSVTCCECYGDGCEKCDEEGVHIISVPVSWPTIKDIYAKIVKELAV